jgi:hypothetical protein
MATAIRFTDEGYQYRVEFRYDPTAVAIIKSVPSHAREYDPISKTWTVRHLWARRLADDFTGAGFTVLGMTTRTSTDDWAGALFRRVGVDRSDAVFRALSRVVHPDVVGTGSTEIMRELLTARQQIGGKR